MVDATSSIVEHYGSNDLVDRILRALADAGIDTDKLTVETLNQIDQLHGGGLNSTKFQAGLVPINKDTRVLDAGCGIGGSSRYLAHTYGCHIDAVDLTSEFVEAATRLHALCGLSSKINVRTGSVTDLPYPDKSFDLVWCQNVSMNVEDKARMFSEAWRVLVPGGRYTFSHAAQGPGGDPYYPLPWAREPSYSFLGTPEEVPRQLKEAGFVNIDNRTEAGTPGSARGRAANDLGPSVIMGRHARASGQCSAIRTGRPLDRDDRRCRTAGEPKNIARCTWNGECAIYRAARPPVPHTIPENTSRCATVACSSPWRAQAPACRHARTARSGD